MSAFAENETLPDPEWTTNPGLSLLVAVAKDSASWTGRYHGRRHSLTDGIMRAMGLMICDVGTSCAVALVLVLASSCWNVIPSAHCSRA